MDTYKVGDMVVYGADGLCEVEGITTKEFGKDTIEYYVLRQIERQNSVNYVPVNNEKSVGKMRHILNADEIKEVLRNLKEKDEPWIENNRDRHLAFKEIILYGDGKDMIRLARQLHLKKKEQESLNRKLHAMDAKVLKDVENIIFEEISYVMEIPRDKVMDFITSNMEE